MIDKLIRFSKPVSSGLWLIRRAELQDLEVMGNLLQQLFTLEQDFSCNQLLQERGLHMLLNDPRSLVLVAQEKSSNGIAGMVTMQVLISTAMGGPVGLVEDLVVTRDKRNEGAGKALLSRLEQIALKLGLLRLQLLADKDNIPALSFYEKKNWQKTSLINLRKML